MKPTGAFALVSSNRERKEFRAELVGDRYVIYLYGAIGSWYGITADEVVESLALANGRDVQFKINSPGGDIFEARAMAAEVAAYSGNVLMTVQGLAASAATFFALSGDRVEMANGAFWMIHRAWTISIGNAGDMRTQAELLDKLDTSIAKDYERKTGEKRATIDQWMADETWFDADDALSYGFVDHVIEPDDNPGAAVRFDLSAFKHPPAEAGARAAAGLDDATRAAMVRRLEMIELGV